MHEAALMRDLMRRIGEVAAAEHATRVVGVTVWVGALSHMTPGHFREHFADAAAGGIAEGAAVTVETSGDIGHPDAQGVRLLSVSLA